MKSIVKHIADDGTEFSGIKECEQYELLCQRVASVMALLPTRPDEIEYQNGRGFILHSKPDLNRVRIELLDIFEEKINHKWISETKANPDDVHPSWVSRLISDFGVKCFCDAWYRFLCTDKTGREWGQPYYADHPEKAQQIKLN